MDSVHKAESPVRGKAIADHTLFSQKSFKIDGAFATLALILFETKLLSMDEF